MFNVLQERIFRHRKYYGKSPSKLAVTQEQRAALLGALVCFGNISVSPLEAGQEEKFMGIPLVVIDVV